MPPLKIFHPSPGSTVVSNFLVAQGNGDAGLRNLIGIIWAPSGSLVAVSMLHDNPPHWTRFFEDFEPGSGYWLEIFDALTRERLACSGPFDAEEDTGHGPAVYFPVMNGSFDHNGTAYGSYAAGMVKGKTSKGGVDTPWVNAPVGLGFYTIRFNNLPLDATHSTTMTVQDTVLPLSTTDVTGLSIT
jgi:hypothetical protein